VLGCIGSEGVGLESLRKENEGGGACLFVCLFVCLLWLRKKGKRKRCEVEDEIEIDRGVREKLGWDTR